MSDNTQPTPAGNDKFVIKKSYLIAAVALIATVFIFFIWEPFGKANPKPDDKTSTVHYNRDEPGKDQVLQEDYQPKVRSMLKQGMSIADISKETGLRRDVIKKIKREMDRAEKYADE